MTPWTGPALAAALLLLISGAVKLRHPGDLADTLTTLGLRRGSVRAAQAVAVVEIATAIAVILTGAPVVCLLAACGYAGFTNFLIMALRDPRIGSCGCGGEHATPATVPHAAVTGGFAVLLLLAAVAGGSTPLTGVFGAGLAGLTVLGYAAVVAGLAWALMTTLPAVAWGPPHTTT